MNLSPAVSLPILYSFRRCPYAIRARMAVARAGVAVQLREVVLRDKPVSMLEASPKGTVPVLVLADGTVIDESLDVMNWALSISDPDQWSLQGHPARDLGLELIETNDGEFKGWLDRYKYADRFPEQSAEDYRSRAESFLARLEQRLEQGAWLLGEAISQADVAIFPFIRQFAFVDRAWFDASSYRCLRAWLDRLLASPGFTAVMGKYPPWEPGQAPVRFPDSTSEGGTGPNRL